MIKAVLFDMDGVLIEAKDWHYEALNSALDPFGMAIDRDAHLATFDGLPTRKKLEILSKTRGFPVRLQSFANRIKQKLTMEIAASKCRPVFQHRFALTRLKTDGFNIAVCSNSIRHTVEQMMELSGLRGEIDLIVSNEDVSNPKPDPEMYQLAIRHFGISPTEALILEDNDHGITAARASGAHVMIVDSPAGVEYAAISRVISEVNTKV